MLIKWLGRERIAIISFAPSLALYLLLKQKKNTTSKEPAYKMTAIFYLFIIFSHPPLSHSSFLLLYFILFRVNTYSPLLFLIQRRWFFSLWSAADHIYNEVWHLNSGVFLLSLLFFIMIYNLMLISYSWKCLWKNWLLFLVCETEMAIFKVVADEINFIYESCILRFMCYVVVVSQPGD